MPFFFDSDLNESNNEILSVLTAFCENFQNPENLKNLTNPYCSGKSNIAKIISFFRQNKDLKNSKAEEKFFFFSF